MATTKTNTSEVPKFITTFMFRKFHISMNQVVKVHKGFS
jgi:hypothetical protein